MPETVRPRTLLLFALVVQLGAAAAVSPALATASEVKLEVNQNCVDPNWPCWATPGSESPALTVKIAAGDEIMFTDHDASTAATVVWTGSEPRCAPVYLRALDPWGGKCTFDQPGSTSSKARPCSRMKTPPTATPTTRNTNRSRRHAHGRNDFRERRNPDGSDAQRQHRIRRQHRRIPLRI